MQTARDDELKGGPQHDTAYRGTSLIRKTRLVGPYSSSRGVGVFYERGTTVVPTHPSRCLLPTHWRALEPLLSLAGTGAIAFYFLRLMVNPPQTVRGAIRLFGPNGTTPPTSMY